MKMLFMMSDSSEISQVWLQRMITLMQADIALIASRNAEEKSTGNIASFSLLKSRATKRSLKHRFDKIRFSLYAKKKNYKNLRKEIKKRDIDVALINFAGFSIKTRPAWSKLGLRVYVHVHGYDIAFDGRSEKSHNKPLHDSDYVASVLSLSKEVDFISNSKFSSQQLINIGVPEHKIHLKYFGVEKQDVEQLVRTRRERGGTVRLLYVGRLIDWKGPNQVLQCFEQLRERGIDATLTIVGDGPMAGQCRQIYEKSPWQKDIFLLGAMDYVGVKKLYVSSDVFVNYHHKGALTNREEAFGVTIIEAMSFGLPVITGASGGVCESVVDGVTGYLIAPHDSAHYLERLIELCSDQEKRLQLGLNGARLAQQKFSLEQEAARIRQIMGPTRPA